MWPASMAKRRDERFRPPHISFRAGLLALLLVCGAARAFDSTPYFPLPSGAQWTYLRNGSESIVQSVQGTRNINGYLATVVLGPDGEESYSFVNAGGAFSYGGAIDSGGLRATYTPGAPMKLADADATLGVAVSNAGQITLTIEDLGSFPFQYSLTSSPQAFETITVPAGTFNALRVASQMRVSGTVSGPGGSASLELNIGTTSWLASGVGTIKSVSETSSNIDAAVTDTTELMSLNFQPVLTFSSTAADWGSQPADGRPGHLLLGPTVTNSSPFTVHLGSAVTGEFALSSGSECTVLAPGQYCFISADFRPASVGAKTGALTITSDAIGSPFVFPLRGIGSGVGIATVTPNALDFGNQDRGVTSPAQSVTLTNTGSAALSIAHIQTTGQYAQANNCGATLAIGTSCQISVTFTPLGTGVVSGSVIIDTQSASLSLSVSGNGVGAAPPVSLAAPRTSFGAQQIGTTSSAQTFTLKNEGSSHLNIYSIGPDIANPLGDFAFTTTCAKVLAAGASCAGSVTFAPTAAGARYGYVAIHTDGVPSGDFLLLFTGTGAALPVDTVPDAFSFTAKTGMMLNTRVASNPITVSGIDAESPISIVGGSYRIDGGFYNDRSGTVRSGQSVVIYIDSGAIPSRTREATLTVGGVSATFSLTTAAGGVPSAPSGVAAVGADSWAFISFAPPSSHGGFPIINYEAICTPVGAGQAVSVVRGITDVTPLKVFPLVNDIAYTCAVRASNDAGPGPFSAASNTLTPSASAAPVPLHLSITGPSSVSEGGGSAYTASVTFNDTSVRTLAPTWSVIGASAAIDATGALSAYLVDGDQQVTLRATYTAGITLKAEKTVTITDTSGGPAAGAASLAAGWNLVGYGLSGEFNAASLFGDPSKVTTVWKWVASKGNWAFYAPGESDGGAAYAAAKGYDFLSSISGGEGFWVNAKTSFSVQMPATAGIASASFQAMPEGWNLIAVGDRPTPGGFNRQLSLVPSAVADVPLNLTTLWAWDGSRSNWYFYAPSLERNGGLASYIQAKNYLDFGTLTLDPSIGFWANKPGAADIAFSTIATGSNSGLATEQNVVVRDAGAWGTLWASHTSPVFPQPQLPSIDFNSQMVLGVILGFRSNGCYSISIQSVNLVSDRITVAFQENTPAMGAVCAQVVTSPFQFIAVPRSLNTVDFIKTNR